MDWGQRAEDLNKEASSELRDYVEVTETVEGLHLGLAKTICSEDSKPCVKKSDRFLKKKLDCDGCGAAHGDAKLKYCSRCKMATYCSQTGQQRHWTFHETFCRPRTEPDLASGELQLEK